MEAKVFFKHSLTSTCYNYNIEITEMILSESKCLVKQNVNKEWLSRNYGLL